MDNRHGRRRGGFEQARIGDTVAFGEVCAGWHERTEILGVIVSVEGNRATLDTGETVVHREVVQVPTPEEIEERTAEIRAGWSDAERDRRWIADTWEMRRGQRGTGIRYFGTDNFGETIGWREGQLACGSGWRRYRHRPLGDVT